MKSEEFEQWRLATARLVEEALNGLPNDKKAIIDRELGEGASVALQAVEDLRRAVVVLVASEDLSVQRIGRGLAEYLARAPLGAELEACVGLSAPSPEPWWQIEARQVRDKALREAARFYEGRRTAQAADEIAKEARRYGASAWRIDRTRQIMPAHYAGTIRECLWLAYSSGATMPLKKRQLQTILSANSRSDAH